MDRVARHGAAPSTALLAMACACVVTDDPGPMLDTGEGPGAMPPPTLDDGMGEGTLRLPLLGDRLSLLVGAPSATVNGSVRAGLVSVFASEPGQGVVLHPHYHSRVFEDGRSGFCSDRSHRFAWQQGTNRSFGHSMGWYSELLGADFLDYASIPIVGAPGASSNDGMVAHYRECLSCASFASSPGSLDLEGDELDTALGSSLGIGIFELANVASPHL